MKTISMLKVLGVLMLLGNSWQASAAKTQKVTYLEETLTSLGTTMMLPMNSYVVKDEGYSSTQSLEKGRIIKLLIKNNSPNTSKSYTEQLAESFDAAEKKFGVPAFVLQALAFVESSYVVNAVNSKSDDYGIMQINKFNIEAYGFDSFRLLTDMQYSVNAGAEVFKWFYDRYPLEEAIQRYNCGTLKSCIQWRSVKKYLKKVKEAM